MSRPTPRPEDFARQFPENGMKLLLQEPANVRDLLAIAGHALLDRIDFDRLKPDPTTFVQRDYRHVESDVVLRGPLKGRGRRGIVLYILIEHQTDPDRLMPFRVLEYVVQIYRAQLRDRPQSRDPEQAFRFQPVLPVVFYTGLRPWPSPGRFSDLIAGGAELSALAPGLDAVFLNLRDTLPATLQTDGGAFGQVLRLYQARRTSRDEFDSTLGQVILGLEALPPAARTRWQTLMSYLHALVYHERDPDEYQGLHAHIEETVHTERKRREVQIMRRTMADIHREEGQITSLRRTLLRLLRGRFGEPPAGVVSRVESCADIAQLEAWLDAFATAKKLKDVGIPQDQ